MDAKIENKINMIDEVLFVAAKHSTEIDSIPALKAAIENLTGIRVDIKTTMEVQVKVIKGLTIDKKKSREECVKHILKSAFALGSYAHSTGNNTLKETVNVSKSTLLACRDEKLVVLGNIVLAAATEHAADLVDSGIDAAELTALTTSIKDFAERIPEPKEARDARKVCTAKLKALCREALQLMKGVIDKLVEVLGDEYADFKALYKNARSIVDNPGKKNKKADLSQATGILTGTVTDATDSGAIEGAIVVLVDTEISMETDEDGVYYDDSVPPKTYTVEAIAPHYKKATITDVEVTAGETTELDISLEAEETDPTA